jgi:methionyl aminopeptidase
MSINIKTPEEIEAIRQSGEILGKIMSALQTKLVPGVTTQDLEDLAQELFKKYDAIPSFQGYHGFPAALCTAVNDEVVHTIPNDKPLKAGDLISIDCGCTYKGMITDSAMARFIGDENAAKQEAYDFAQSCIRALWAGINMVKPGAQFGDISHAIGKSVRNDGYSIVKELTGHGVGHKLHEDPTIPNHGKPGTGAVLEPGMTFALEPIITMGSPEIKTLEDGWNIITKDGSLACQHEHTILVTEEGNEVLTLRPGDA